MGLQLIPPCARTVHRGHSAISNAAAMGVWQARDQPFLLVVARQGPALLSVVQHLSLRQLLVRSQQKPHIFFSVPADPGRDLQELRLVCRELRDLVEQLPDSVWQAAGA